jgi:hypothetical protein
MAIAGVVSRVLATPLLKSVREFIREGRYTAPSHVSARDTPILLPQEDVPHYKRLDNVRKLCFGERGSVT